MTTKDFLKEFADWLRDCGEEASYLFDSTDEAIERFLKERDK